MLIYIRLDDVVNTTIGSLQTLSRSERIPAFGSVFLLNNISYLRTYLLRPRAPLFALLSRPTQDVITSSFRTAKAGYFDSNFSPLIQVLADDKDSKGGKAAMKEKFVRFFDLLEEVKERHKMAKVLEGDDEDDAREMLMEEAVKLVVPSLQRFTQKTKEKEFSKSRLLTIMSLGSYMLTRIVIT